MITVWKYELNVDDKQWLELPRGYKYLSIQVQNEKPCLWVQVDTEAVQDSVLIVTYGTGHPMKSKTDKFIGSYTLYSGSFVGHVFEAG